jgi:[histone H3]-lysine4/36 N-trimethyltransferase SMYD
MAWATLKTLKGSVCNWCLLRRELFRWYSLALLSSQCKSFYYCSQDCQRKDWAIHKHECKLYQQMANNKNLSVHKQIASEFVLNLRLALFLQRDPALSKAFFDHVSLEDHQPPEKMQFFQEMAVVLLENMGEQRSEASLSRMMRQLNVVAANAFTIQDFLCETDGVAIGFFSPASYINHDCHPNATQFFDGRFLTIIANRDIALGEEITISYTNPLALIE